ncbi:MAG: hypothetical protein KAJ66_06320, partial [Candidatus Omnitrophica bacterium]|nr:hypothetical protein [Candidatus Omnitrophota bacterium]
YGELVGQFYPFWPPTGSPPFNALNNACYVILTDYEPDTDMELYVTKPTYHYKWADDYEATYDSFVFENINVLRLESVREVPYNSGNFVSVENLPIFVPDDGKGRGLPLELINMPYLNLKFNQELSNTQINTVQAVLTIGSQQSTTYDLTETASNSGLFTDAVNNLTVQLDPLSETSTQSADEITCLLTSLTDNINNKIFNLKESASDSLNFTDIKSFVTVTFEQELSPDIEDALSLQYTRGLMATEVTLTETNTDSKTFTNEDGSLSVVLNNHIDFLPDILNINIPNDNTLELSNPKLALNRLYADEYIYDTMPLGKAVDVEPIDPSMTGEGVFKVRLTGLSDISSEALEELSIILTTDIESKTLSLNQQEDGSYATEGIILVHEGETASYEGIHSLQAINDGNFEAVIEGKEDIENNTKTKAPAFTGQFYPEGVVKAAKKAAKVLRDDLGYFALPINEDGIYAALTKKQFLENVPKHSVWFTFCHGRRSDLADDGTRTPLSFKHLVLRKTGTSSTRISILPNDVVSAIGDNEYKLVFLDSCWSADPTPGSNTDAFISAFRTDCYIGWTRDIGEYAGEWAAGEFFKQCVDKKTMEATFDTNEAGKSIGCIVDDYKLQCLGGPNKDIDINLNHPQEE